MRLNWTWIAFAGLLIVGFYHFDQADALVPVNFARALWQACDAAPGDTRSFKDRFQASYANLADRSRQAKWWAIYGRQPGGLMLQQVYLPKDFPDAKAIADQICQDLQNGGITHEVDAKFPTLASTDSHEIALQTQQIGDWPTSIFVTFSFNGFVQRGDPRKAINYATHLVRRAVADKCSAFPTYSARLPMNHNMDPEAIITDLPDEPDTVAAIAKMAGQPTPPDPPRKRAMEDYDKALKAIGAANYRAAIGALTEACKINPTSVDMFYFRGQLYAYTGNDDAALEDYYQALKLDPDQPDIFLACALAHQGKNDWTAAMADYDQAINLDPKMPLIYLQRAIAYIKKPDNSQAIADANRCLERDPKSFLAYDVRGTAEAASQHFELATADFEKGLQLQASLFPFLATHAHVLCANAYAREEKYDQALSHYRDAIASDPNNVLALNDRAWLLATCTQDSIRNGKQAVDDAAHANALTNWKIPAFIDTYAIACAEAGDFDNAVKWESQCVDWPGATPDDVADAKNRLALFQARQPYHAPFAFYGTASVVDAIAHTLTPTESSAPSPSALPRKSSPVTSTATQPDVPVPVGLPNRETPGKEPAAPTIPAQPNWTWTTLDGKVYQNVVITKVESDMITITHSLGVARIPVTLLPPDLKKLFNHP